MKVPFSKFLGFVSTNGPGRVAKARECLDQYSVITDFYRRVRPAIVEAFRTGDLSALELLPSQVTDERKRNNFPAVVAGFQRWMTKNDVRLVGEPIPQQWSYGDLLRVSVSPEAIITVGDTRYLVKLHLNQGTLSRNAQAAAFYLMAEVFDPKDALPAVLDVRRSTLLLQKKPRPNVGRFVRSEAAALEAILRDLRRSAS